VDEPSEGEELDERTELERFIATRMLRREGDGRHERIGEVTLHLLTGPHADLIVPFTGDRVEGGRGPANDLILDDSAVSQSHFELVLGRETICLRDLGSTNGTWLGPVRVGEVQIPAMTIFKVGETDIEIIGTKHMRVPASKIDQFGPLRGKSTSMRELFVLLERLAATDLDTLIEGEPGTGKRLAAETLHQKSKRSRKPLVIYDCGGERDSALVEEALFGSKDGPPKLLEQAKGGTLVLRRTEDLPVHLQPRLFEVLLERDALRESTDIPTPSDVRFVFLSTLDLRVLASEGLFHEKLHEKIAKVSLRMPPLRDREGDAIFLMEHAIVDFSPSRSLELSPDALRALPLYSFPGNVRELRGVALRAVDNARGRRITRRDLLLGVRGDFDGISSLAKLVELPFRDAKDLFVQRYFMLLEGESNGELESIVRRSGVSVSTIRRMLPHLFR